MMPAVSLLQEIGKLNLKEAGGRAQHVRLNHKYQRQKVVEAQRKKEEEDEEESKKEEKPRQSRKRQERSSVKVTLMAYYPHHIFDTRSEFSTVLRARRLFQYFLVHRYCKVKEERLW